MKHIYTSFSLFFCCIITFGQNLSSIQGFILDEQGIPIENSTVYIDGNPSHKTSDSKGFFFIEQLEKGTHSMSVFHPNYSLYNQEISLISDSLKQIFIVLKANKDSIANHNSGIEGYIFDENHQPVVNANLYVDGNTNSIQTDPSGYFSIYGLKEGAHNLFIQNSSLYSEHFENIFLSPNEIRNITITLNSLAKTDKNLDEVVVYGKKKVPNGLDMVTRIPIDPQDMIQNISIIPEKIIKEQGALSLSDATQNVAGVTLFGSYGGVRESMSIRGYRGTPVLKNGVQVDSDFRTASIASDMQGVESIQVLKGSAALTQGIGDGLGSPGGVINVVTKTPKFKDQGNISIRTGSWGMFRPTLDFQTVLDKKKTAAIRINSAYERSDSYKSYINKEKFYINPSFEWRPDDKTRIVLEMDYLDSNVTPDIGTINLAPDNIEALFKMPHNKFLGFKSDNMHNKTTTYSTRLYRDLTNQLMLRLAYAGSSYQTESTAASLTKNKFSENGVIDYSKRYRTLNKSARDDKNQVIQLDLIGKDVKTGFMKHTFQAGFDFKKTDLNTTSYSLLDSKGKSVKYIDVIDVYSPISNVKPAGYTFGDEKVSSSNTSSYGFTVQDVVSFNSYIKAMLGVRYSSKISQSNSTIGKTQGNAWDPFFGVMITPIENINIFGSYTTTSDLRSAANRDINGKEMGSAVSKQWEMGFKSSWFENRLFFNATYFNIRNSDLQYGITDGVSNVVLYYILAGDLKRSGIELELTGKILPNLQAILGYSYLDAKYEDSPSYVDGSRPMNAPNTTFNGWLRYAFDKGALKDLSLGAGVYYVGSRPVNEWSLVANGHGTTPGVKPFLMPSYLTVNAQAGYKIKQFDIQVFFNNIFNELGYNSYYRGGFINQIDPSNFGIQVGYNF